MKKRILLSSFALLLLAFLFFEASGGVAQIQATDRTGSPVASANGCDFCHSGGDYNTSVIVQVLDGELPVTAYDPGETYTFKVTVNAENNPAGYGFQAVALSGDDHVNAGRFGTASLPARVSLLNNRQYFEHQMPSGPNSWSIDWTAPAAGTGEVRIYAAGNAVDGNNSSAGDQPATLDEPLVLTENVVSSTFGPAPLEVEMEIFPNPVSDLMNLRIRSVENDRLQLRIFDSGGRVLRARTLELAGGRLDQQLAVGDLPAGIYFLQLSDGQRTKAEVMFKE